MSPPSLLKSLFLCELVTGDYRPRKKNEILVDLFLSTLFHTRPLQPKLPVPFIFYFISASLPTGPLRVEVRSEATWLFHVAEHEQPGNKGLLLLGDPSLGAKLSPSPPPL